MVCKRWYTLSMDNINVGCRWFGFARVPLGSIAWIRVPLVGAFNVTTLAGGRRYWQFSR